jgi:hypothetical protein
VNKSRQHGAILTIIAVLLGVQVWMGMASQPVFASESQAAGDPPTFPNASKQREDIVAAIKELSVQVKRTNELLESSTLHVEVSNIKDFAAVDAE